MKELLDKEIERHFRPEFLNRLDSPDCLPSADARRPRRRLWNMNSTRSSSGWWNTVCIWNWTAAAKEFLIDKGYNPEFGARPLRRAIERYIEDPLSEDLLARQVQGQECDPDYVQDEEHLRFEGVEAPADIDADTVVVHTGEKAASAQ